jgi:hypothetical protein
MNSSTNQALSMRGKGLAFGPSDVWASGLLALSLFVQHKTDTNLAHMFC